MPFTCIPLEVQGHVLQGLSPQDQARFRAVSPDTVYGYTIAVVNEQFIDAAGSMEVVDSLSSFDVRWFPLNTHVRRTATLGTAVLSRCSGDSRNINCRRLIFLLPKSTTSMGHVTIGRMQGAYVERGIFIGFGQATSVALPDGCFSGCGSR